MNKYFILFTILVFFTGLYLGTMRIVIPVLERQLGLSVAISALLPLVAFGFIKGPFNFIAGKLSDSLGRKLILTIGWLSAFSFLLLLIKNSIYTVIIITIFLAINQAFTWTSTVTSQIDISGKRRAGLATGINEMSGYLGVAVGNLFASHLFSLNNVFLAIITTLSIVLSISSIDTKKLLNNPPTNKVKINYIYLTRIGLAGLIEKFVDSSFFILIPTFFLIEHYKLFYIGIIVSSYSLTWAILQPLFGYIADFTTKRRLVISIGFFITFLGFLRFSASPLLFSIIEGLGMSMLYPNLIALVNDEVNEKVRGKALGYYRLYRDSGYGISGLLLPLLYSLLGFNDTLLIVGSLQLIAILMLVKFQRLFSPSKVNNI
ncbi:MAG: MFS transporter [Saccharolobus sp.]|jgi:MFS family permease|uniref:MFS transporter n=1 Tax=Saccharolobus sp. TaxID=2100761 RepID=UPI0028CEAEDF|nr:MFS transporter [Saccharolobus sp.]MDT7862434.1 MFS transporter [Saccharolobus sp.]